MRTYLFPQILVLFFTFVVPADAQSAGSLDPTYGSGGYTLSSVNFFTGGNWADEAVMQPDDKLVVTVPGDNYPAGTGKDIYVLRYQTDGNLDPSFGTGGIVRLSFTTGIDNEGADGLDLQADGKIVIGANSPAGAGLARLNTDGTLDTSFGTGGKVSFKWATKETAIILDLAIQNDGRIVVGGYSGTKYALARFTTTGAFDTSFNGTGKWTLQVSSGNVTASIIGLTLQPDGKIVGVGARSRTSKLPNDHAVVRLNANGTLDSSFGTNGQVYSTFDDQGLGGSIWSQGRVVAIDPTGRIVVGGHLFLRVPAETRWAFARFLSNGQPDPSFGGDGKVVFGFAGSVNRLEGSDILLDNGKILGSGVTRGPGGNNDITTFRLLSDGSLDGSFGTGGVVTTDVDGRSDIANTLTQQSDGKYLVAGFAGGGNYIFVGRYLP